MSPVSPEYQHAANVLYSVLDGVQNKSDALERLSALPLTQQCGVIEAADRAGFDWILDLACRTCTQRIVLQRNLRAVFEDGSVTRKLLGMTPRATDLMRSYLMPKVGELCSRISAAPYRNTIRLYYPAAEYEKRADIFIMPTHTLDDIVYIMRDYKGFFTSGDVRGPIVPLLMANDASRDHTVINQGSIECAIQCLSTGRAIRSSGALFNGLTYKSNDDGSLVVALAGSERCEGDVLVTMKRTRGRGIAATKVIQLAFPVLTFPYALSVPPLKGVPSIHMVYDMDASFMIRPYSHIAAYIDIQHNINILDLDSAQSSRVTTHGDVSSICWSPDGTILAYATLGGTLNLNNCSTKDKKCFVYGQDIRAIQWSTDGTKILLMFDKQVKIVNSLDGLDVVTYTLPNTITRALLSDDASKILLSCTQQKVYLFDIDTRACHRTCKIDNADIRSLLLSPDNQYAIISCMQDGGMQIYIWDTSCQSLNRYNEIGEVVCGVLAKKIQQGRPCLKDLTMAQLILLTAAAQSSDTTKFSVHLSHPLCPCIVGMAPVFKKYIMSKLNVLS
jgi:hypothetical protein